MVIPKNVAADAESYEKRHAEVVSMLDYPYINKRHLTYILGKFGCSYSNGAVSDLATAILTRAEERGLKHSDLMRDLKYVRSNYFLRTTQFASTWFPFEGANQELAKVKETIISSFRSKKAGDEVTADELHEWTLNQVVDSYQGGFRVLFVRFRERHKTDIDTGLKFTEPVLEKRHVIVRPKGIEIRGADSDDAIEMISELNGHFHRVNAGGKAKLVLAAEQPLLVSTKRCLDAVLDDLGAELVYYSGFAGATCKAKGIWSEHEHDDAVQRCLRARSEVKTDLKPYLSAPLNEASFQLVYTHPVGGYVEGPVRVHVSTKGIRFLGSISEAALNRIWGSVIDAQGGHDGEQPKPAPTVR